MDEVLDKAIVVFTERGYHATSISDLSAATELTAGSLYKAFTDKKAIFLAAFDRYKYVRNGLLNEAIGSGKDGRDCIHKVLQFYAEAAHGEHGRRGCLVIGAAVELALFDADTNKRVEYSQASLETLLENLVRQGQSDGSIGAHIDARVAGYLLYALIQGLRVVGKSGQDRDRAMATADAALTILN